MLTVVKTVTVVDLARYSDLSKALVDALGPKGDAALRQQIIDLIETALVSVGTSRKNLKHQLTGDGAIIFFEAADHAVRFGEALHRKAEEHNGRHAGALSQRHFRVGICTDEFAPNENDAVEEAPFAGIGISNAARLEKACRTGEVVICDETRAELPREMRQKFGKRETVTGKRDETFEVFRWKVTDPAPEERASHLRNADASELLHALLRSESLTRAAPRPDNVQDAIDSGLDSIDQIIREIRRGNSLSTLDVERVTGAAIR